MPQNEGQLRMRHSELQGKDINITDTEGKGKVSVQCKKKKNNPGVDRQGNLEWSTILRNLIES